MSFIVLTQASSGAPTLAGQNGTLVAVLDWAVIQAGWSIKYSSGDARVYETVNGLLLHVNDNSSVSGTAYGATIRGVEAASGATTFTDPYPTEAQHVDSATILRKSNAANATASRYTILLDDDFLAMFVDTNHTGGFDMTLFGRVLSQYDDTYASILLSRRANNTNSTNDALTGVSSATTISSTVDVYWMRDISGAVKSSRGCIYTSGAGLGVVTGAPVAQGGYMNMVMREPVAVTDAATTSTTPGPLALSRRGYVPNLWSGVHAGAGGLSSDDTFQDSDYNPSANFRVFVGNGGSPNRWVILEETDTWNPY